MVLVLEEQSHLDSNMKTFYNYTHAHISIYSLYLSILSFLHIFFLILFFIRIHTSDIHFISIHPLIRLCGANRMNTYISANMFNIKKLIPLFIYIKVVLLRQSRMFFKARSFIRLIHLVLFVVCMLVVGVLVLYHGFFFV